MTLDKGHHVQTAFLDLSKAYDRVSIPGLLFKLSDLGFQEKLCAGSRLFSQTDSNVSASMEAAQIHNA